MPEPRQHTQNRGWIESILRRIPGFKGYLEKEYRRDSDALQRTWLAERLQRSKRGLDAYGRMLVDARKLDIMAQLDHFRARLDKAIGRLRGGMQGYSGFFDLVQVDESRLDSVYEHDVKTMDAVETLAGGIEKLDHAAADAPPLLDGLNDQLGQVEQAIDRRQDMLKGLD
jgi:hypothetical protein